MRQKNQEVSNWIESKEFRDYIKKELKRDGLPEDWIKLE